MADTIGLTRRKRDMNAELNLTPFIDLLSTCVCFLLVTAIWIEVASVEIKQHHGTEAASSPKESYELDVVFKSPTDISLNLKQNNRRRKHFDVKASSFDEVITKLNDVVANQLMMKDKKITIAQAMITPRSTVDYGNMVAVLDVLRSHEIVNIGVISTR
ncbi:MAG: biopolymer transporter ExbD [Halobacteriovoraceae bacterium]|nr:biopolymer transporter ExbD [Halobacteriovoraceae bacterium]MCB9093574.1 biopolymer transporter ExbD [Halobacteriovoraceae bacterium]